MVQYGRPSCSSWKELYGHRLAGLLWERQFEKILLKHGWEKIPNSNKIKTKLACILEADESRRLRMGNSEPNYHEDHIARKGDNSLQLYILVHQIYSYASSYENSCSESSGGQGMGKLEKTSAWNLTKVNSKKQVIDEARTKGATVHFASLMDICHLKNAELEAKHQKYKGRVVLRSDLVKDDSESYAVFTEQGSSASQMTASKNHWYHLQIAGLRKTSSWCSVCFYPRKLEHAPKSECPDIWIRLPRHIWPKSWSSMEDPVVPLERNMYGHPLAGLLWERLCEKILLK